jgi:hypothetical protein
MSRPKLNDYAYYNFQIPRTEKLRLQTLAQSQGQTLSTLLLDRVRACDLLIKVVEDGGEEVEVWRDGDRVVVANNGHMVKI